MINKKKKKSIIEMDNIAIAKIFQQVADLLEIQNANSFRVRAYQRAAQILRSLPTDLRVIAQEKKLDKIPGIGVSLAEKINELLTTGKLKELAYLTKKTPLSLTRLGEIEGVGPKLIQLVYRKFKVTDIVGLKRIVQQHHLSRLSGFSEKTEYNILEGIKHWQHYQQRFLLGDVDDLADYLIKQLKNSQLCQQVIMAGSFRRRRETVGDLGILVTSRHPVAVMKLFCQLPIVKSIIVQGKTKTAVLLTAGIEVDLRVVSNQSFASALFYFTGSKAHNIHLRQLAVAKKMKINEYGIFSLIKHGKRTKEKLISAPNETAIYRILGLSYIPPELREGRGEIMVAKQKQLPKLIKLSDIKGDLHLHSRWSDGTNTVEEMIKQAIAQHYQYLAITDHASPLGITHGLNEQRIKQYLKIIKRLQKKYQSKIALLLGIEVDILANGSLSLPNKILQQLDIVIASVHTKFKMSKSAMTKRILLAINNPMVNIIAHPTGVSINRREPYPLDLDKIMLACRHTGTILELNSFPRRLDLNDINCRRAKELGVKIAINTDAHNISGLSSMCYGIGQARRGWLEKKDVINTFSLNKLKKFLIKRI